MPGKRHRAAVPEHRAMKRARTSRAHELQGGAHVCKAGAEAPGVLETPRASPGPGEGPGGACVRCLQEALARSLDTGHGGGATMTLAQHCRRVAELLERRSGAEGGAVSALGEERGRQLTCWAHDDHSGKLPSDLMALILSMLPHAVVAVAAGVSTRWRRCAASRAVWSTLYTQRAFCKLPLPASDAPPASAVACMQRYRAERTLCWDKEWVATWHPHPSPYILRPGNAVTQPETANLDNIFRCLPAVRSGRWFWEVELLFSRGVDGIGCAADLPWTAEQDTLQQDLMVDGTDEEGNEWPTEWHVPKRDTAWMWNTHGGVVDRELYLPAHPAYTSIKQREWRVPSDAQWKLPQTRSLLRVEIDVEERVMHLNVNGERRDTYTGIAKNVPAGTPIYMFVLLFAGGGALLKSHGKW